MMSVRAARALPRPIALVTGGSRGIGRAIVAELADTHHVLVGGRDEAAVGAVVGELTSAAAFVADLSDEASTVRAAAAVDRLDVLVHCAGVMPPLGVSLREAWRAVLEVNVVAVAHLTDLLLPRLRAAEGLCVFINSGSGLNARGDTGGYSASKFALTSFADGLRDSERGRVRVASVHPGRVDTDMQRELQGRRGRDYRPEEHLTAEAVAAVVRGIVEAPPSAVIETVVIRPSGMS